MVHAELQGRISTLLLGLLPQATGNWQGALTTAGEGTLSTTDSAHLHSLTPQFPGSQLKIPKTLLNQANE